MGWRVWGGTHAGRSLTQRPVEQRCVARLNGRADGHSHAQVHLVLCCHCKSEGLRVREGSMLEVLRWRRGAGAGDPCGASDRDGFACRRANSVESAADTRAADTQTHTGSSHGPSPMTAVMCSHALPARRGAGAGAAHPLRGTPPLLHAPRCARPAELAPRRAGHLAGRDGRV